PPGAPAPLPPPSPEGVPHVAVAGREAQRSGTPLGAPPAMVNARAASRAGSARDHGPPAAAHAAPAAQPTAKPPITYPASLVRLRAPATSPESRRDRIAPTSSEKRAMLMVIATVGEHPRKIRTIVVCTPIPE